MLLAKLLTTLALAASTTVMGSALPTDKPANGQYVGYINNAGEQVAPRFSGHVPSQLARIRGDDADNLSIDERHALRARDEPGTAQRKMIWSSNCRCGQRLDRLKTDRAVEQLKEACGDTCYLNGISIWGMEGDVIAFICGAGGPIKSFTIAMAFEACTDRCGWYVPGTVGLESSLFGTPLIGYMQYKPGMDVCKEALASKEYECPERRRVGRTNSI